MMQTRHIPFGSLALCSDDLHRGLGYGGAEPPDDVKGMIRDMIDVIAGVCRPACGYALLEGVQGGRTGLTIDGTAFATGSIIADCLAGAECVALFVATAGVEFGQWFDQMHRKGDVWEMFLADAIGSEIAEAAARAVLDDIAQAAAGRGMMTGNSYSPGYCGWSVREQQKLFAMLPGRPCGITLNDSSLMTPIKSVSGIVALGREIEKKPYGCDICTRSDCFKKRPPINLSQEAR